MKRAPAIILCLAGMATGIVAGRMLAHPSASAEKETASSTPRESTGPIKQQKHDLNTLIKWQSRLADSPNPDAQRELERMNAPALRDLITRMTAVFSDSRNPDWQAARQVIVMASVELFRRDGEAALEWAASIDGDRELMLASMLEDAAFDSPDLAKHWIERMSGADQFHKSWAGGVVSRAIAGATSRGADDLLRLRASYGDLLGDIAFAPGPFPPGFEFQKLFTSLGNEIQLTAMVQYWTATDREAAWKSVKESIDSGGKGIRYLNGLFTGVAALEGSDSATKWLIPRIQALPENIRPEAITTLSQYGILSAESVSSVMASLTQEEDRIAFAKQLVTINNTSTGQDLAALRGLSSDAARSVVLLAAAGTFSEAMATAQPRHAKAFRTYFRKTMEALDLPKDSQAEVMKVLESQGTTR
ncbi:hypothetical protein [Luteolibacter soli]|uniref:HEAT repeat domain-containing protein n=1 Tax=Luteolibacter soli TaxID=3135280 RepID=A0ABU9AVL7_9BACT